MSRIQHIQKTRRRSHRGFTLTEILVAVLLLSGSLTAIFKLWSVSRNITEHSRDTAEYYAIARQEAEKDRLTGFKSIFNPANSTYGTWTTSGTPPNTTLVFTGKPRFTDYDQNGNALATVTSLTAAATLGAYYRAVSTYSLMSGSTAFGSPEYVDSAKRLGVQKIQVYAISNVTKSVYDTSLFFTQWGV